MFNTFRSKVSAGIALATASVSVFAAGPVDTLFAAVDLSTVATGVTTLGLAAIGITLAMKGISLVKRAVNKV